MISIIFLVTDNAGKALENDICKHPSPSKTNFKTLTSSVRNIRWKVSSDMSPIPSPPPRNIPTETLRSLIADPCVLLFGVGEKNDEL